MRLLHTMLRVGDLQKSIQFYTEIFGMKLLRQSDNKEYEYTLAFLGYGDEDSNTVIELTYNWGKQEYDHEIREMYKDKQIDVNNHEANYAFIQDFVVTHIDGIKLKKGNNSFECPTCRAKY